MKNNKPARITKNPNSWGVIKTIAAMAILGQGKVRMLESQRLIRLPAWFTQTPLFSSAATEYPVFQDWSLEKAIKEGLKQSVWVYRCCRIIASNAAAVKWVVKERKSNGDWEVQHGHPIEILLKKPNNRMSGNNLFERLTYHLHLGGNGIWHKVIFNGMPVELWPISPDRIRPIPDEKTGIKHWDYQPYAGRQILVDPDKITHFMLVDPSNIFWGLSPLQAGANVVDTDLASVKWQKISLGNRCVTDGVFSFKHPLRKDQWLEAKKQVEEQKQGPENARQIWVLGADAEWKQTSLTPVEMDLIESRNMGMYEIHAIFGVDPLITGAPDRSGRANKKEAKRALWEDTIIPYLDDVKEGLNLDITPYWDPESIKMGAEPNLIIDYDLSGIAALRELIFDRAKTAMMFSKMKVPFDKINDRLNLGFSEFEGWDQPVVSPAADAMGMSAASGPMNTKQAWSKEKKAKYWKAIDDDRIKWEERLTDEVRKQFKQEEAKVASAFLSGGEAAALAKISQPEWQALTETIDTAVVDFFGQREADRIEEESKKARKAVDFDPLKKTIQARIKKNAKRKSWEVTKTTKKKIARVIADGKDKELTNVQIARDIRDKYESIRLLRMLK